MQPETRRPIASRRSWWARALAGRLARSSITPNQISQASMGFAAVGAVLFWGAGIAGPGWQTAWLLLAALTVQLRLVCNLVDGMVAVEGGKSGPTGPFWNEAPDRVADALFLAGAGLAAGWPSLGLGCAVLAVGTAYLRELGRAEGLAPDFSGPMAKPHRMALLTLGAVIAALLPWWAGVSAAQVLRVTLALMVLGLLVTIWRRAARILSGLAAR